MTNTILISGKSGSGKDMFAHFMKEELEKHGKRVLIIHFGDAVKWVLRDYFNWDGNKDIIGRTLLQRIGTDVVRACYPNFWTGIVVGLIKSFEPYNDFDIALVPDARFPNEVEIPLSMLTGCITTRIERTENGEPWINTKLTEEQRNHASETSLDHYAFDYIIHNDEGLDMLRDSAIAVLKDTKII